MELGGDTTGGFTIRNGTLDAAARPAAAAVLENVDIARLILGSLQEESERSIRTKVADTAVRPLPLPQP